MAVAKNATQNPSRAKKSDWEIPSGTGEVWKPQWRRSQVGAGPDDDDELKRVSGQSKTGQKRLRAFVDDKVATMKDDALAQGYNSKDQSHRQQMSRMEAEYRIAIRTRLGMYNRKSEIQNAEAVVHDFRN